MKTKFKITAALLIISSSCFAQIPIGSIDKEKKEEVIIPAPEYDPYENFITFDSYYRGNKTPSKRCEESEYYKRYLDLDVYYPTYTSDYKQDEFLIFKKRETIIELNWSDLAEKYFTIKNIEIPFEKTNLFTEVIKTNPNLNNLIKRGLLFKLEDKTTKEIIYVVAFDQPAFVLTEYYTTMANVIPEHTFVAIKDFNGRVLPLSDKLQFIEKGSEWKAEFTLLRKSDMNLDENYNGTELQDILYMVVLTRNSDKIITYFDSKDYYESLWTCFDTKESVEADKQAAENEAKQKLAKLTNLYGEAFAKDIINHKLTIGMSKEMCQESVGITLNRWSYTDADRKIEVWEYVGSMALYFTNGKLTNIITY